MRLEVTFRNLRPRDEIRKRAEALFAKLERFLDAAADAHLVVAVEHGVAVLELVVSAKGATHKVIEEDRELRSALDKLFHKMETQLRRHKERLVTRRRPEAAPDEVGEDDAEDLDEAV
jgi:putative sigma-54 modulation protein